MAVKFLNGIDVDGSMNIAASDVPNLDASKITSGTLSADRIPNLSGVYQPAGDYLDLETANTTFQPLGNYLTTTSALDANRISSGTLDGARMPWNTNDGFTGTYSIVWRATNDLYTSSWLQVRGTDDALLTRKIVAGDNPIVARSIGFADAGLLFQDNDSYKCIHPTTMDGTAHADSISLGWSNNKWKDGYFAGILYANGGNSNEWNAAYDWGNHASAGYLTSLPSHNHDTLYDAIGSANAVGQALNERIDTEVFDAIASVQATADAALPKSGGTLYKQTNTAGTSGTTFLTVHNNVGGDISQQQSFVDFMFTDTNANFTPQVRIGAQVGRNADANAISKEGAGAFVVYTGDGTDESGNGALSEAMRIGFDNKLYVQGEIQASGYNKTNWDTAYGWGNHASAGYLTSIPSTYATDAEVNTAVGAVDARIDNEVFPAINDLGNAIPTNNNQLTNGAGYITSFDITTQTDGKYLRSNADDSFSGNLTSAQSKWIKFYHPTQTDSNDGKIGAGVFDTGLNIVGVQTVAGTGRQVRVWGDLITSAGVKYATESYVNTAVSNLVDTAPAALNTLNELAAALGDDANFSTTVANNIGAIDTRINDEVMPYIASVETIANGKLDATAKAADSNLLDGINSTSFLRSDQADTMSGTLTITGSNGVSRLRIEGTTPTIDLDDADGDSFYIHVNSNNFYVLTDRDGGGDYGTWEGPHPLQLEADTNSAYVFGNKLQSAAYAATTAFDSAGSADAVATALNQRIDTEVFDAIATVDANIPTNNNQLTNGAGYLTSVPSALSVTSLAVGSGVTLTESTDRADLLMIKSSTSTWGGLQISNTSNEIIFSLMGDGTTGGIYDDQNSDWLIQWTENAGVRLYHNAGQKLTTTSTGITITGEIATTGGNSTNWNTAYGWGNHASAGYLTSIPSDYVRQGQDIVSGNIHPVGDRQQLLGLDTNRWQIVFCEILDSAGQHEKNLQNPAGETSVADYATGTVMVWENGKNVPCTTYANHMRMGIAVENVDSPMIQGAEPVLVTGAVAEGDYLVTSTTEGHAVAVSRDTVKQEQLWDCVIGKALEGGEGESHLIKTWVTI